MHTVKKKTIKGIARLVMPNQIMSFFSFLQTIIPKMSFFFPSYQQDSATMRQLPEVHCYF